MSHHHESFPGTVTLRPATFVAVMRDVASSLSRTGFTHVLFINGGCCVCPAFSPNGIERLLAPNPPCAAVDALPGGGT